MASIAEAVPRLGGRKMTYQGLTVIHEENRSAWFAKEMEISRQFGRHCRVLFDSDSIPTDEERRRAE